MSARTILANANGSAELSECERFRYTLTRDWDTRPRLLFCMLNPSTAGPLLDDPTIRRCATFAHAHDFGGMEVVNLFAYRATDPKDLQRAGWPVGPENDRHIREAAARAGGICVAWGAVGDRGPASDRVQVVMPLLAACGLPIQCLRITRSGFPGHPLYLPSGCRLQPFTLNAIQAAMEPA